MSNNNSILSSIGGDIIGIISPVSICMLLVVLLVYSLSSPLSPSSPILTAANLVYSESPSDSSAAKLEGALLNAAVFVTLIAAVTFLLVLLYYYNCTNLLKNYMRFSAFFVLGSMGGSIALSLIRHFSIGVDYVTFCLVLFNFTVIGVLSVLGNCVPIVLKQGYMVVLGIIVAAWFTKLPEWTTWVLLIALAVYDLVAVLAPGGPLKILVELASSREDELPALVYEARPTVGQNPSERASNLGLFVGMASGSGSGLFELQELSRNDDMANSGHAAVELGSHLRRQLEIEIDEERSPLVERVQVSNDGGSQMESDDDVLDSFFSDKGIKLGLGDFVFYSVLVGRAAMYDLMTVYACYLAIICGLGCTLILLAVFRHALPALPISIMLGVTFYFLTRLLMEPFLVGTSTSLMMF